MKYLLEVLIEHSTYQLNKPFTYFYEAEEILYAGVRVLVGFANQTLVGYVVEVKTTVKSLKDLNEESAYQIKTIRAILDKKPLLNEELMNLADDYSTTFLVPKIKMLQAMLPPSLKPKKSSLRAPKVAYTQTLKFLKEIDGLSNKQAQWLAHIKDKGTVNKSDIPSPHVAKALIDKGLVEVVLEEKRRLVFPELPEKDRHTLTKEQNDAVQEILGTDDIVYLLQGVTGSGKTEVYLSLTKQYLSINKKVLIIVPEIALTPMMVNYFYAHFKDQIAILHSELTPGERYDEYRHIAEGKAKIVVGTRSAVFAPLSDLGLIILDEEQVDTYKQDQSPFYHAREIAIRRAKYHQGKVILGSATPSLDTKARANKNLYHPVYLTQRIKQMQLPSYEIVDLKQARSFYQNSSLITNRLAEEIKLTLTKKQQVILLLNRRGYAPSIQCRHCGNVYKCPQCHISLTYHSHDRKLKCHYCDYSQPYPIRCEKCGSQDFYQLGFGIERAEEEIKRFFPEAKVGRLDSDIGKTRTLIAETLNQFAQHKFDILLGTQMVAKGHDFPLVTLVGILSADYGLSIPSFRSAEQTFQLIAQAIGRSGRGDQQGRAIIQTYSPSHYAITYGARQDYEGFYQKEMKIRQLTKNPPFWYLLKISIAGKNLDQVIDTADQFALELRQRLINKAIVVGPSAPFISKIGPFYHRHVLLKYKKYNEIIFEINEALKPLFLKTMLKLSIDFEPLDV